MLAEDCGQQSTPSTVTKHPASTAVTPSPPASMPPSVTVAIALFECNKSSSRNTCFGDPVSIHTECLVLSVGPLVACAGVRFSSFIMRAISSPFFLKRRSLPTLLVVAGSRFC